MTIIKRPELNKIDRNVTSFFDGSGTHIMVTGPFGSGKSSIFKFLMAKYGESHKCIYINFKDIIGLPEQFLKTYLGLLTEYTFPLDPDMSLPEDSLPDEIRKNLDFLIGKNKTKELFFNVILFPELNEEYPQRIIMLDDFEYITSLKNFQGFEKIETELLEALMIQKNTLYIATINARSSDDAI